MVRDEPDKPAVGSEVDFSLLRKVRQQTSAHIARNPEKSGRLIGRQCQSGHMLELVSKPVEEGLSHFDVTAIVKLRVRGHALY
jgi:hypothetical protein